MQESLTLFFDEYAPEMCYTLRKKQIIVKMTGEFAVCSDQLKVFVSYSHDDEKHKEWVYKLSCDLVKNGIDTILDQWDLK